MVRRLLALAGEPSRRRRRRARLRDLPRAWRRRLGQVATQDSSNEETEGWCDRPAERPARGEAPAAGAWSTSHGVGYEVDVPMSTLLQPARHRRAGDAATRISSCAKTRTCCTVSPRSKSARAFRQLIKHFRRGRAHRARRCFPGFRCATSQQAVALQDSGRLTQIPGIGKKTAERLLLELKGKLAEVAAPAQERPRRGRGECAARARLQRQGSARGGQRPCARRSGGRRYPRRAQGAGEILKRSHVC